MLGPLRIASWLSLDLARGSIPPRQQSGLVWKGATTSCVAKEIKGSPGHVSVQA